MKRIAKKILRTKTIENKRVNQARVRVTTQTGVQAGGYFLIYDRPTPDAQVVGAAPA